MEVLSVVLAVASEADMKQSLEETQCFHSAG